ncbi:Dimethylaniline monooxygenase [N-oxide-forming] 5 [Araneus ventricosus]|uniref:Flavin-containing monooxygenase n=1 Tax=Araneus ventricosus TaxID=182803 RepID=A0A4Y2KST0_ARAVE|nr:Dimethylaniline monooxygenase [N-oxide-forming] 5 [Araneus ventricosus]
MQKEEYEEWMPIDEDIPVAATLTDLEICQVFCEEVQAIKVGDSDGDKCVEENTLCLKEEGIFQPGCFEKTDKPGGTWCYRNEVIDGVPSIMSSTIINHSKEIGALSKYPPPKEFNNFMRHGELYQYFMSICESTDALKHIRYNMEISSVKRADDYEESGRWIVTVKNTVTGEISTDVCDGVLVCTGQFSHKKMPTYTGQELFKGEILHTHGLRGVEKYRNKKVVVVGMGCSGLDAAVEISNAAKQVYLSTRSGAHVL